MNTLKYIKLQNPDGTYTNPIPVGSSGGSSFDPYIYDGGSSDEDKAFFFELAEKCLNGETFDFSSVVYYNLTNFVQMIPLSWMSIDMNLEETELYGNFIFSAGENSAMNNGQHWSGIVSFTYSYTTESFSEFTFTSEWLKFPVAYNSTASSNVKKTLTTDNTIAFTPIADYNPATKKYVDDQVGDISTILATLTTISGGGE